MRQIIFVLIVIMPHFICCMTQNIPNIKRSYQVFYPNEKVPGKSYSKEFDENGGDVLSFVQSIDPSVKSLADLKVNGWCNDAKCHTWAKLATNRAEKLPYYVSLYSSGRKHLLKKIHLARKAAR